MFICPNCRYVVLCCQTLCPRCGTRMEKYIKATESKPIKKHYTYPERKNK